MPQPPQMPPDFGGGFGLRQGVMPPPRPYDPRAQMPTILPQRLSDDVQFLPQPQPATRAEGDASSGGSLFSSFASTQPTTGAFGRNYVPPPGMMRNPEYTDQDRINDMTFGGLQQNARSQFIRDPSQPQPPSMFNMMGGFNPMMGGGIGAFGGRGFMGYR